MHLLCELSDLNAQRGIDFGLAIYFSILQLNQVLYRKRSISKNL